MLALAAVLPTQTLAASDVAEGLYSASVETESRDDKARASALRQTLAQVIDKVVGRPGAARGPARSVLDEAESLVSQFGFSRLPSDADAPEDAPPRYRFRASFSPDGLAAALNNAGVDVWPARRPRTVVLAVIEGRGEVISRSEAADRLGGLIAGAQARGIPLTFPLNSVEDRAVAGAPQVTSLDTAALQALGRRYDAAEVLAVRVSGSDAGGWRAQSTRVAPQGDDQDSWTTRGATADAALQDAAAQYADRLYARYALAGSGFDAGGSAAPGSYRVRVLDVPDFAAHAALSRDLEDIAGVRDFRVVTLAPGNNTFELTARIGRARLAAAISRLPGLSEVQQQSQAQSQAAQPGTPESLVAFPDSGAPSDAAPSIDDALVYRWVGR